MKVGKIEQLTEREFGHAPFDFQLDPPNLRSKMVVLITDILMDDGERRSRMVAKAERIVDLFIEAFK